MYTLFLHPVPHLISTCLHYLQPLYSHKAFTYVKLSSFFSVISYHLIPVTTPCRNRVERQLSFIRGKAEAHGCHRCVHTCLVAARTLASGCTAILSRDWLSSPFPEDIKVCLLLFPPFLPVTHSLERNLGLHPSYADLLCCPCVPFLLMEGLAPLHLSHAQFILVDGSAKPEFTQAWCHWAVFYNTNSDGQWGGLLSSSSLPFGIGTRCLWDRSMAFLYEIQWPSLGQFGSPLVSFHLALKAGSHPWASLRIWKHCLVAQSGWFFIKQPTLYGSL